MTTSTAPDSNALDMPTARLVVGITGHRSLNAAFAANRAAIAAAVDGMFVAVDAAMARHPTRFAPVRLVSPLAEGTDLLAALAAQARGWDVALTLPFGTALNAAIQCGGDDPAAVLAELARASDDAAELRDLPAARRLELADQDDAITALLADAAARPADATLRQRLAAALSRQSEAAAAVMVDQVDLLVAVWDGATSSAPGGTRDTIKTALARGLPVWWIDARAPDRQTLLRLPEDLAAPGDAAPATWLAEAVAARAGADDAAGDALHAERWRARSPLFLGAYRWFEDRFAGRHRPAGRAGRHRTFERADAILTGSYAALAAAIRALPGLDPADAARIEREVVRRFAWADGISTWLSDAYRGAMTLNFVLAALAITAGVAYLPLTDGAIKWPFALIELLLLLAIVGLTVLGRRRDWHGRWLQTRRAAEYLRHAPILLLLGVARPAGLWPVGQDSGWPERYARDVLREAAVSRLVVTQDYLRSLLRSVLRTLISGQIAYHHAKAAKLAEVHHRLDRVSEWSFRLALIAVAFYIAVEASAALHVLPHQWPHAIAKPFTFLGVFFPTLGGALAGIRYFGDFERFAAISETTAGKLASVLRRLDALLADDTRPIGFAETAEVARGIDEIVVGEIESWQAVFANKIIAVPG